jgi:benzodiazapine receptor
MASENSRLLKWLNTIAFVAVVLINGLAGSTTLIGGQDTAQVSDNNFTLITPAGYTFAIWGIIYTLLGLFVIYQALPSNKGKTTEKVGWFFILSCIANIFWLFLWQFEFLTISVVLMFLLFASLLRVYLNLGISKSSISWRERIAVHAPFSVYFGWITIASIANVAAALVSVGWNGFGLSAETWGILVILIALLITTLVVITRRDVFYGLVIVWALIGISAGQSGNQNITLLTQINAVIVVGVIVVTLILQAFKSKPKI